MKLFTIFSPEKEIYYKVREWAGFGRKELKKLVELGWLERGGLEKGYLIHQIVRDSITRQMKKEGDKIRLEEYGEFLDQVIDTESYLSVETPYDKVRERLVLTEDVARFLVEGDGEDTDAAALFNNIAVVYRAQGDYAKALEYNGKALAIRERVLGPEHPDTATTYNNIGGVYRAQGDYAKALEYYRKANAVFLSVLGEEHPCTQDTAGKIGIMEQLVMTGMMEDELMKKLGKNSPSEE
jgi:tetratricopeptide (TPR) repeat protein